MNTIDTLLNAIDKLLNATNRLLNTIGKLLNASDSIVGLFPLVFPGSATRLCLNQKDLVSCSNVVSEDTIR